MGQPPLENSTTASAKGDFRSARKALYGPFTGGPVARTATSLKSHFPLNPVMPRGKSSICRAIATAVHSRPFLSADPEKAVVVFFATPAGSTNPE